MDRAQIFVTILGALSVVAVIGFFFLAERRQVVAAPGAAGAQEVRVVVKGGYDPDTIVARRGQRLRIDFYRDETSSCSETVVFGDFGIARALPPFQTTPVEFTPDRAGEFTFTCGMGMMHGKLIVSEPKAGVP